MNFPSSTSCSFFSRKSSADISASVYTYRENALWQHSTPAGVERDFPTGDSEFILSADVHHAARGLEKIRLANMVARFFAVDRAPDKFCQVGVVSTASQDSI